MHTKMIPLAFLAFAAITHTAHATPVDPVLFDERVRLAKEAQADERYRAYPHAMFKRAGRHIARTMRSCIAGAPKPKASAFVLVADINAAGKPEAVQVKPDNRAARCFAAGFSSASYLKPPEYAGRQGFPVTLRVSLPQ